MYHIQNPLKSAQGKKCEDHITFTLKLNIIEVLIKSTVAAATLRQRKYVDNIYYRNAFDIISTLRIDYLYYAIVF